jgi:hypothetical protein
MNNPALNSCHTKTAQGWENCNCAKLQTAKSQETNCGRPGNTIATYLSLGKHINRCDYAVSSAKVATVDPGDVGRFAVYSRYNNDPRTACTDWWQFCVLGLNLYEEVSKWPNSKPHWATRQQVIAKTPEKWSAYQIPSEIFVFIVLVFKVQFVSFYSEKPPEALNLLVTEERYWALFYMPLYTLYTICWMYWYRLQIKWDLKTSDHVWFASWHISRSFIFCADHPVRIYWRRMN